MADMEGFTALRCSCGGTVKITPAQVDNLFIKTDGNFVYIGGGTRETIKCEYCGTEFERFQPYKSTAPTGNVSVGPGGVYIGGPSSNNVIITGNGNIVGYNNKR